VPPYIPTNFIPKIFKKTNMSLETTVIKNDLCSGCGACSYIQPEKFQMKFDQYEMIKAYVIDDISPQDSVVENVCPFSNNSKNEDTLAQELYPEAKFSDEYLGRYNSTYVGYANEGEFRTKGSSGGTGKWLLQELLNQDQVDYVIQVAPEVIDGELFSYRVYKQGDNLTTGAKSAYYPITLDGALDFMKEHDGRYAVTAVPCFSKALRNLADNDELINKRLSFIIGIVCGHLKSAYFAKLLSWQVGINPESLKGIDFRGEIQGGVANDKALSATSLDGNHSTPVATRSLFGGNWGYNFFKYKACDYCDDVMAETADISIGDAWLPEFINDSRGHNVIVCRNTIIDKIIKKATIDNKLSMETIAPEKIAHSQLGGFKHRREGLNYRITKAKSLNEWTPNKRFITGKNTSSVRKNVYNYRIIIREQSEALFKKALLKNDLSYFIDKISPLIKQLEYTPYYYKIISFMKRAFNKIKRTLIG